MWPRRRPKSPARRWDSTLQSKCMCVLVQALVCVQFFLLFILFSGHLCQNTPTKVHFPARSVFFMPLASILFLFFVCCLNVHNGEGFLWLQSRDEDTSMDPFFRNSLLFRKKMFGSMLDPHRKPGVVCHLVIAAAAVSPSLFFQVVWRCRFSFQVRTGYDGLGGRTKYIQPVSLTSCCRVSPSISTISNILFEVLLFSQF